MTWMGLGGFVYFGAYEETKKIYLNMFVYDSENIDMSSELTGFGLRRGIRGLIDKYLYDYYFKNDYKTFDESMEFVKKMEDQREDFMIRREAARKKFREEISASPEVPNT